MVLPVIVLSIMLFSGPALAAEYRITPADRVQPVIDRLQPGDTLFLDKGQYTQTLILNNLKGTAAKAILIDGQGVASIQPSARDGIFMENCSYIILNRITVQNAARAGIVVFKSRNIAITGCVIRDNRKWGIQSCLSDRIAVERCEVSGTILEHGIYFSTTDHPIARDCRVHHNAACGIQMNGDKAEGGDGMVTGGLIEDNTIHENGRRGGAAINMDGVEQTVIRRNRAIDNYAGGISCFVEDGARAGSTNRIVNNSVRFRKGEGRYAFQVLGGAEGIVLTGNALSCGRGPVLETDPQSIAGFTSDGNVFFGHGRKDVIGVGDKRYTLKQWRKMSGQDRGSVVRSFDDATIRCGVGPISEWDR